MCNINTTGLSSYYKEGQILFEKKCLTCEKDVGDLMKKTKWRYLFVVDWDMLISSVLNTNANM
jgi:hypothetical protein